MKIQKISHKTLAETAAGKLAASLLDGTFDQGGQLPPERELINILGISRATLREALKSLEEHRLIESRRHVGWFARKIDETNITQAKELAGDVASERPRLAISEPTTGPRRIPVSPEKPIHIPNLQKDRLGTFEFISWWEREKVQKAKVLVIGAGALGNEVIKNLALMGVGNIFIIDFDKIEAANLSRSVLFRETDNNRSKAEVVAARAKSINPEVHIQYLNADVTTGLGLGIIRRMDAIVGCLDNREARLAVNRFCYWMNKPWVDGAIQELLGLMRVFKPGEGACYECTLTEQALRDLSLRYSCQLLARQNVLLGKVPTTPTIASIIGGMQSQEALKLIHDMTVEPGKVVHFNGLNNMMHTTAYVPREECESHWAYGEITELPARAERTTLQDLLRIARSDLGAQAVIELDQELVTSLECPSCHTVEQVLRPLSEITFEAGHCPTCGLLRDAQFTHLITGDENFLHRTLSSVGVPPLHILRAQNGLEYRFYELTGDLPEALHFRHFEHNPEKTQPRGELIRLKSEVHSSDSPTGSIRSRIRIKDDSPISPAPVKSASAQIKFKQSKKDTVRPKKVSEPTSMRIRYKSVERSSRPSSKLGRGRVKVCKI
ncbi:MAG: ThiF family adenylyltransferase [Anaerolineae bacterium]|nr:ThiF family adenylyltransferase [Anaerolineae bacterium]MCI0610821.1 ThiF family adenylyltransferase [Anaerolineae bacterium]